MERAYEVCDVLAAQCALYYGNAAGSSSGGGGGGGGRALPPGAGTYDGDWRGDAHVVTTMMSGLARVGAADEAVALYHGFRERAREAACARGYGRPNQEEEDAAAEAAARAAVTPHLQNALIAAHARATPQPRTSAARAAFDEALALGVANAVGLSSLLDGYLLANASGGRLDEVFGALLAAGDCQGGGLEAGWEGSPEVTQRVLALCAKAGVLDTEFEAAGRTWFVGEQDAAAVAAAQAHAQGGGRMQTGAKKARPGRPLDWWEEAEIDDRMR